MDATQRHVELASDLTTQVHARLIDPLSELIGGDAVSSLTARLANEAEMWAAQLLGEDPQIACQTARLLLNVLYGDGEDFAPPDGWWSSTLGQIVLIRLGHPSLEHLSYAQAGAMLGITRQGVHDLVSRGKLQRHVDGGVTAESVRERATRLHPNDIPAQREHTRSRVRT